MENFIMSSTTLNMLMMTSLCSFFIARKKILMCLLSLEFLLLNFFLMTLLLFSQIQQAVSYSTFMLVLGACEAGLGLSLLINMTRFKGSDMLSKSSMKS